MLADLANGVLLGCSTVAALFAGGVTNRTSPLYPAQKKSTLTQTVAVLGVRATLFLGSLGYALYIGSLWCFQTQGTRWFVVLSGALLGISAALLWNAQGTIMLSYPLEKDKGTLSAICSQLCVT